MSKFNTNEWFIEKEMRKIHEYWQVDLTRHRFFIEDVLFNLIQQYYSFIQEVTVQYDQKNQFKKALEKQLLLLESVSLVMHDYFNKAPKITKKDVYLLLNKCGILDYNFNEIFLNIMFQTIKNNIDSSKWDYYDLEQHNVTTTKYSDYRIILNNKEIPIGKPDIEFSRLTNIMNEYINNSGKTLDDRVGILNELALVLNPENQVYMNNLIKGYSYIKEKENPTGLVKQLNAIKID
jgi:hypothetical protein